MLHVVHDVRLGEESHVIHREKCPGMQKADGKHPGGGKETSRGNCPEIMSVSLVNCAEYCRLKLLF